MSKENTQWNENNASVEKILTASLLLSLCHYLTSLLDLGAHM